MLIGARQAGQATRLPKYRSEAVKRLPQDGQAMVVGMDRTREHTGPQRIRHCTQESARATGDRPADQGPLPASCSRPRTAQAEAATVIGSKLPAPPVEPPLLGGRDVMVHEPSAF